MRTFFIRSAVALATGAAALPAGGAFAQDLELNLGQGGPQLRMREACDPQFEECYQRDRYVERRAERGCSEGRALDKAERMGIRRARIDGAGRRTIEVRGRDRRGDRVFVTFARAPGCPVID